MEDFTQKVERKFGELVIEHYFNKSPFVYASLYNCIVETRKTFPDKKNMFDRLFEDCIGTASVSEVQKLFPPSNLHDLLELVRLVESDRPVQTLQDALKQQCLIYYLLLDADGEAAEGYATETLIPESYQRFMSGCNALDRGDLTKAVDDITSPDTTSTYPDVIIQTLDAQAKTYSREKSDEYIIRYFDSNTPHCSSHECITIYLECLSRLEPMSALTFIRSLTRDAQKAAFECLVRVSIEQRTSGGVWRLANLPLTIQEADYLKEVLENVSDDHEMINEILVTRSLHLGDVRQAKKLIGAAVGKPGGEERWGEYESTLTLY